MFVYAMTVKWSDKPSMAVSVWIQPGVYRVMRRWSQWSRICVEKVTCCFKLEVAKMPSDEDVAVDCVSKWRLNSSRMKHSGWIATNCSLYIMEVNKESSSYSRRTIQTQEVTSKITVRKFNSDSLEIRINLDRMGLYFKLFRFENEQKLYLHVLDYPLSSGKNS